MSNKSVSLKGKVELLSTSSIPTLQHVWKWKAIKAGIYFNSIKMVAVKLKPFSSVQIFWIEPTNPMIITPS